MRGLVTGPAPNRAGMRAGDLDPNTHQPFDLERIYQGSRNPPAHLAASLGRAAGSQAGLQQQQQEDQRLQAGQIKAKPGCGRIGMSKRQSGEPHAAAFPTWHVAA
jgi:hypothetical protein